MALPMHRKKSLSLVLACLQAVFAACSDELSPLPTGGTGGSETGGSSGSDAGGSSGSDAGGSSGSDAGGSSGSAGGAPSATYTDSRGNAVGADDDAIAFATSVIAFTPGNPWTSSASDRIPEEILFEPDRPPTALNGNVITLGVGGSIVVGFDVYITDGDNQDIYVFEVGAYVEATRVEVSDDLKNWLYVGDAAGSASGVDLRGQIPAGGKYRYVRLTDLSTEPNALFPGADIDAVAALHPVAP